MNKVRKQIIATLCVVFMFLICMGTAAATFDIVLMNYDPNPAEPGSYVELDIKATNSADSDAPNAMFEFVEEYPFSLDASEEKVKSFGTVGSGKDISLDYKVRVDAKAVLGDTAVKIRSTTDGVNWVTRELTIDVKSSDAILGISSIDIPDMFIPGETADVDITFTNFAETTLKDVTLKLDLAKQTVSGATGVYTEDLPFIPVGSGIEQKVKFLAPNEENTFSFKLRTYADAESKIYKIPIELTYKDKSGNEFSKSDILGVVVGATPKLSLELENGDNYVLGTYGNLPVKIVNKGVTNAKFLTASIIESEDYTISPGHMESYIGGVDSDDYETVDFKINANKEDIVLKVKLDYMDANNKEYSNVIELPAKVYGAPKQSPVGMIVFVLLIAVVGFFIYKKKKSKSKKH